MSLPSSTGQRALDIPATPTTPLVDASLGRSPQVLTQAPLGTEKIPKDRLALVDVSVQPLDLVKAFFAQIYHWSASDVVVVSSWEAVKAELGRYSSIGELVILSHSVYSAVSVHGQQLTADQFVTLLAPVAPKIESLTFDGCVIGNDPAGLHTIATRLNIKSVSGWTFWHYLDWWRIPPTGDNLEAALQAFRPLAARASPYLPKTVRGDQTYSVAEQEPLFAAKTLNLVGEYFVELLQSIANTDLEKAVIANQLDPGIHRTRGSAEIWPINSDADQKALEAALNTSRPVFARAVVTNWTTGATAAPAPPGGD